MQPASSSPRAASSAVSPADSSKTLLAPPKFDARSTPRRDRGRVRRRAFLIAYILAFILYMVITLYGVAVMRSVVTEKTSRVMELMVATIKPRSLMAGKILGVGGAGLVQITVWLGSARYARLPRADARVVRRDRHGAGAAVALARHGL